MSTESTLTNHVEELFDSPEFAGVVFQHWHVSGGLENGSPEFASRKCGKDLIERLLRRAEENPEHFEVRAVYWEGVKRELDAAYAELRKQRPAITAVFDRAVWERSEKNV